MIVKGKVTKVSQENVEVNPHSFMRLVLSEWKSKLGIPTDSYINENGMWEVETEYRTSHSFSTYSEVREATEEEKFKYHAFCVVLEEVVRWGSL